MIESKLVKIGIVKSHRVDKSSLVYFGASHIA